MKVLLFSGGLDSTAIAFWQRPDQLLFIDYGQVSAAGELRAAEKIASDLNIPIVAHSANCKALGSGHLAGKLALTSEAPEFWPYRNQLLITLAAMAFFAQSELQILIGTVSTDHLHADGRMIFVSRMNDLLRCQGDASVVAPAIEYTSADLLRMTSLPQNLAAWTFSCHKAPEACGQCRGCHKHGETISLAFDS